MVFVLKKLHHSLPVSSAHRFYLTTKRIDVRYFRLLEQPFLRSRPNYLAAVRSPQRLKTISSGQLLRCIQVLLPHFTRRSTSHTH